MYHHSADSSNPASNSNQHVLPLPPYSLAQQQSINFGQHSMSSNAFALQQQWMRNGQNILGNVPTNSGALKRQMEIQEEEKENSKRARAFLDPPIPEDGPEEMEKLVANKGNLVEEEADDEEEEEENSRSTKTESSSSQNSPEQTANGTGNVPQFGAIPTQIYSGTPQPNAPKAAQSQFAHFAMTPSAPLAHSTPVFPGNIYAANANAIRNLQQIYAGNFHQMGSHYGIPNAQLNPSIGSSNGGGSIASLGISTHSNAPTIPQTYLQNQQLFGGVYGATGYSPPSGNMLAAYSHQQNHQIHQRIPSIQQITPPSFNSSISFKIGNDSGVGDAHKNESSSGGSSEESSTGAPHLTKKEEKDEEPKFPPYFRQIVLDGQRKWADLEGIIFDKPVPSRLSVLNTNQYKVSLAEIHRRLQPPEFLNTSYLSGVLRRAKKLDGGKMLREELSKYECGLDLQSGKRKMSQVTAFTTLCEREALQLATDFDKIANDPQNGFPHQEIAVELSRRTGATPSTPEQRKKRMEELRGTMEILGEAISIVQQAIGVETMQMSTAAELVAQPTAVQQLMPQTMDQFKRFARLSHCFGNRAIIVCWETMLKVFGHYERLQGEFLPVDFGASSSTNSASFLQGTSSKPAE